MSRDVELELAWQPVADRATAGRRAVTVLFIDVVARYRRAHRRYHGVAHLVWVLRHAAKLRQHVAADAAIVNAALFFHDAVYDPRRDDNEARSAELATHRLAEVGWPDADIAAVADHIVATAGHLADDGDAPDDEDGERWVVLDADLGVLGADPAGYADYVTGVRAEYAHLDDASWRAGRTAVVSTLLARPNLYRSAAAREWWDDTARANLTAELAALHTA